MRRCSKTSRIDWDSPEIAARYDRNSDHQFMKGQALIAQMNIKKGDAVLDVGCGTGRQALSVYGIIGPTGTLTGVDPSSYRLSIARSKLGGARNAHFIVGRGEDLGSLADNSFDHVYYCSSFHWVDDKRAALREAFRVLKPGGNVGMTTLDRSNSFGVSIVTKRVMEKYGYPVPDTEEGGMKRVTQPELEKLLADAGFTDIRIELKTVKRYHKAPDEALEFHHGSFDDRLKGVPEAQREAVRHEICGELEKMRTPQGITFESKTMFAIAVKPLRQTERL